MLYDIPRKTNRPLRLGERIAFIYNGNLLVGTLEGYSEGSLLIEVDMVD